MSEQYNFGCLEVNNHGRLKFYKHGCTLGDMKMSDRMKLARQHAGLTQTELATKAKTTQQMISKLERGLSEESADIVRIAMACGVRPEWLAEEAGDMLVQAPKPAQIDPTVDFDVLLARLSPEQRAALLVKEHQELEDQIQIGTPIITWEDPADLPEGAYVFVPRFDVHVSAGNGHVIHVEPLHEKPQAFRSEWVKRKRLQHKGLMCVYAHGDSMTPRINDGDSLLVDRNQKNVIDGRIYVLRYDDEVRVKRLFKRAGGGLLVRSDNTANYPDMIVTTEDMQHVEIIGRVVHVSGEV